jgi:hypothetical protein
MRLVGGGWSAAPPPYPCFVAESDGCTHRLSAYLDVGLPHDRSRGGDGGGGDGDGGSEGGGGNVEWAERFGCGDGSSAAAAEAAGVALGCVMEEEEMIRFFLAPRAESPDIRVEGLAHATV